MCSSPTGAGIFNLFKKSFESFLSKIDFVSTYSVNKLILLFEISTKSSNLSISTSLKLAPKIRFFLLVESGSIGSFEIQLIKVFADYLVNSNFNSNGIWNKLLVIYS
jgi:hypothetical protein